MSNQRVAVLIDADNIPASLCDEALRKCEALGNITIKRAYGDFTNSTAASWRKSNAKHAIVPMQNNNLTKGKNAADIALVIDAMDFLHNNQVDIFCIVSSDSDFTRLATRLRECGREIYGYGEKNKSVAEFISACKEYSFLSVPRKTITKKRWHSICSQEAKNLEAKKSKPYCKALEFILKELEKENISSRGITLNDFGKIIKANNPNLKYSDYGGKTLKQVILLVEEAKLVTLNKDTNLLMLAQLPIA